MAMKSTSVRMDADILEEAKEVLDAIGLSFNAYVTIALKQLVLQRAVPFDLKADAGRPMTAAKRHAAREEERVEAGSA